MPVSVLMLAPRPQIRGPLPKIAPLQIEMLEARGYSVDVAYWGSRFDDEPMLRKLAAGPLDLLRALRALREGSQQILFVNTAHDVRTLLRDLPLLWSTRHRDVRRILLLHGSLVERLTSPGGWVFKLASRAIARSSDAILLLSTAEAAVWRRFEPRGRYCHVVNPFIPGRELSEAALEHSVVMRQPERQRRILFVGRLIREKGIVDLLKALKLVNAVESCRLTIAGTGPLMAELVTLCRNLGLANKVDLRGYLGAAELARTYASADIFVLPTYWDEGFPTVISEAMSVGLPIITTRIRGAADLLTEGEHCLFVEPRNPEQLAAQILQLLQDSHLAQHMSAANRACVDSFRPNAVAANYAHAFEAATAKEGRQAVWTGD